MSRELVQRRRNVVVGQAAGTPEYDAADRESGRSADERASAGSAGEVRSALVRTGNEREVRAGVRSSDEHRARAGRRLGDDLQAYRAGHRPIIIFGLGIHAIPGPIRVVGDVLIAGCEA